MGKSSSQNIKGVFRDEKCFWIKVKNNFFKTFKLVIVHN